MLYIGGVHCHFMGIRFVMLLYFIFYGKSCLIPNTADPDKMPHYVASDLDLHCLPMTSLSVSR